MPELVFLEAPGSVLSKLYSTSGVNNYPLVKNFSSHHQSISSGTQGLQDKAALILEHGNKGHCLFNGTLIRPLENEPRAGLADKDALSHSLIIDVDSIPWPGDMPEPPFTKKTVKAVAEIFVSWLPAEFQDISYLAQASNSFGMKLPQVSLHIEFMLERAVSGRLLKKYLTSLNFGNPFEEHIVLRPAGTSLGWPIDITMAENTRIVYIAPPRIEPPLTDPFATPEDRLVVVKKKQGTLSIGPAVEDLRDEALNRKVNSKIEALRRISGLPKKKPNTQAINFRGTIVHALTNPDSMTLEILREEGNYLRLNVNGGDSGGYYVDRRHPNLVRNFKGELPFLLEKADPGLFERLMNDNAEDIGKDEDGFRPLAFRDVPTDTVWNGFYHAGEQRVRDLYPVGNRQGIKDFYADYGYALPDQMPQVFSRFDPHTATEIDMKNRFVNLYTAPTYVRNPPEIPPQYQGVTVGEGHILKDLCPSIYKVIHSITGSDDEEFEYFLNWVAFIVQHRRKTTTAYVLQGTQGTGKGVFFNEIMRPIIGEKYTLSMGIKNLDDLSNKWVETALFAMIDEVRLEDARDSSKMLNIIKNLISEEQTNMRAMRQDNRPVSSYTNFLFSTNNDDALAIPEGDRRFNVCPPQMTKLEERHPELAHEKVLTCVREEVGLFAGFILRYTVDVAVAATARETESKNDMRKVALLTTDTFCLKIRNGDLDYFIDHFLDDAHTMRDLDNKTPFDNIMKNALSAIAGDSGHHLSHTDIQVMYRVVLGSDIGSEKLGKMLSKHRVKSERKRLMSGAQRHRVVTVKWALCEYELAPLIRSKMSEEQQKALGIRLIKPD